MKKNPGTSTLLLIGLTTSALAQGVRFGGKAGVPLTTYFDTGEVAVRGGVRAFTSETRRYTFGPSIEWRLGPRSGFAFDVLYKRFGYVQSEQTSVSGVTTDSFFEVKGNSWDIPMMAKYRWDGRVVPYAAGGFVLRYLGSGSARGVRTVTTAGNSITTSIDTDQTVSLFVPGATIAFGVEVGRTGVRLLPEIRYSRWRAASISGPLHVTPNQVEFLVGFLF